MSTPFDNPFDANHFLKRGDASDGNTPGGMIDQGEWSPPWLEAPQSGGAPHINEEFSPGFQGNYFNLMNNVGGQIQQQYQYNTPLANAAQMNTGGVPQPGAQQYGGSKDLDFLLSGQGYDPATLAKMHSGATDQVAGMGAMQMSQARRALGDAGYNDSPAGAAIQADVARQSGQQQTQANNQIDIQNAQTGNQNRLAGVGMQTQIGMSNMEQANQMALSNANRLFSALSQNTANQQQTNLSNAGAQQKQMSEQAGAVSGFLGNQTNMWGNAALNKAAGSEAANAGNTLQTNETNTGLRMGGLLTNFNERSKRYANASNMLGASGLTPIQ